VLRHIFLPPRTIRNPVKDGVQWFSSFYGTLEELIICASQGDATYYLSCTQFVSCIEPLADGHFYLWKRDSGTQAYSQKLPSDTSNITSFSTRLSSLEWKPTGDLRVVFATASDSHGARIYSLSTQVLAGTPSAPFQLQYSSTSRPESGVLVAPTPQLKLPLRAQGDPRPASR
jgi:hypothetical protein